ncbi:hypothetical protein BDZ94DRAFT_1299874 [Collybia nuda]|uniref:RNA polymerase II degradation factor 1 n=1 Tax=Collybia nuda TaxID=64659 RepID=A0A9P6CGZ7_9AGAR|nr:hypothetical protein BDZ94DRAFT_1299874 [Collybia nuda]
MSQYKSAIRTQQPPDAQDNSKYRSKARQLQELFPTWSNDDLQSLLAEVGGDVQIAATRITDGVAEQWGSVSRKKDKKAPTSAHASKDSFSGRGDFRGARGGRGGRGGPGRGGAAMRGRGGPPRGGAVNGRSPRTESPHPTIVDITPSVSTDFNDAHGLVDASVKPTESTTQQNGVSTPAPSWSGANPHLEAPTPTASAGSSWGAASTTSTWGGDTDVNGSSSSLNVNVPSSKVASKSPATSKLSWAQIAKPQEKSTPPPAPAPVPPRITPATTSSVPPPPLAPEPEIETQNQSWEEPTTVQPPTWDDEPQVKPPPSTSEAWPGSEPEEPGDSQTEVEPQLPQHEAEVESVKEPPTPEPPAEQQLSASKSEPAPQAPLVTPVLSQGPAVTPSPKLNSRSAAVAHRSSARYKTIDQPVVMPSSFGSGIEKVGMQFGSLSLGGESLFDSNPTEPEVPVAAPEPASPPTPQAQVPVHQEQPAPSPPATAPASTSLGSTMFQQQQALPQQTQAAPSQPSVSHHPITQSTQQVQTPAHAAAATSPIQQYAQQHQQAQAQHQHPAHQHQTQHQTQQHSLASAHQHQQQHQQPPHPQTQQNHNQYAQHGLPTHIDPSQQTPNHQQNPPTHSSYFGRSEAATAAPYFHTPTPPAAQAQENPYGSFGQLGGQGQHQQGAHLGGFASADYGYSDSQRGFYDNYAQQSSFGNRNVLGHDDVKGLPGAQQPPPTSAGIPPSNTQPSQPHASLQGSTQPQPAGAQAPQQGYPMPYPYYSYPQSQQFYGYGPNYAQPFKYPTMFQAPPGPGSAPSPVAKQPTGVQPQNNPYGSGLYPQGGYEEYQQHPHHQQHQHTHSLGLGQGGVGAGDYSKQLYGGAGQGGMQGFMGLGGQGAGQGVQGSNGGPRGGGSPETPYKPYASKDVGVPAGRGATQGQGQGQVQPQGQGQTPQGQGFYGAARFGGSGGGGVGAVAGGVGGPQQNAHHPQGGPQGHLAYPQGSNDGSFYPYQRQQPQYWQ